MYYVYILESEKNTKHWYVGVTRDLNRRLNEHNAGDSIHTNKFKPWKIKNYTAFNSQKKAEAFERYLKSNSGRVFSKRHY
ncbi:excinuclease ABC subunit C [Candidatus Peregrinibacteria bacterium CG10_big_fil_rev_8_21_14_0_10_49_10]|nr:MAG: excinuclease ABC subunit C [Candidatus Peregrinibacteria bacterium CG10_big_fil_rev_8_21_14_0_10_49_10]